MTHSGHRSDAQRPRIEDAKRRLASLSRPAPLASFDGRTLTMWLNGPIGRKDRAANGIFADPILQVLRRRPSASAIHVEIDSPGGVLDEAFAIHDALLAHPAKVTVAAGDNCLSAATVILMAGDHREAYPDSRLLIHRVAMEATNLWAAATAAKASRVTGDILRMLANSAEDSDARLAAMYSRRSGSPRAFFERELRSEDPLPLATAERIGIIHSLVGGHSAIDLARNERLVAEWQAFHRDRPSARMTMR